VLACPAAALLTAVACSTFDSTDTATGADADVGDALTAATDGGVPDALVSNDGFENGSSCAGWMPENSASATPVTSAHSGARSCRVCAPAKYGQIAKTETVGSRSGSANLLLWVRADDDPDASATGAAAILFLYGVDGGRTGYQTNTAVVSTAWTQLQVTASAGDDSASATVVIQPSPTGCMLVDDVSLTVD